MNINLCLTKNYANDSPPYPAKTKPILPAVGVAGLPGLKRQLYRTKHSTTCQHKASSRGTPSPQTSFFPIPNPSPITLLFPPAFVLLPMVQSHRRLQARQFLPPPKPPILTSKLLQTFTLSNTYSSAISPLFLKFLLTFHTLKHFSTPQTPVFGPISRVTPHLPNFQPPFFPQNQGALPSSSARPNNLLPGWQIKT
jgi:hypothetical protein